MIRLKVTLIVRLLVRIIVRLVLSIIVRLKVRLVVTLMVRIIVKLVYWWKQLGKSLQEHSICILISYILIISFKKMLLFVNEWRDTKQATRLDRPTEPNKLGSWQTSPLSLHTQGHTALWLESKVAMSFLYVPTSTCFFRAVS